MPVALLNYLDRQMLASMKFSVMSDIPSIGSEENWGLMLGQFKWVYAAFSLLGGYLADRFSRRFTIFASVFVWAGVTWGARHVKNFNQVMIARLLVGVCETVLMPPPLAF